VRILLFPVSLTEKADSSIVKIVPDITNLISEEIHKVIIAVLLGHFWA